MVVSGVVLLVVGLAIVVLGRLCGRGMVPPNGLVGIRIPSVMAGDEQWYAGHRAAGWWICACGACFALGGLGALLAGGEAPGSGLLMTGLALGIVALLIGSVVASRAARSVTAR